MTDEASDEHPSGFHPSSATARLLDFAMTAKLDDLEMAAVGNLIAAECEANFWFQRMYRKLGWYDQDLALLGETWNHAIGFANDAMKKFLEDRDGYKLIEELRHSKGMFENRFLPPYELPGDEFGRGDPAEPPHSDTP